MVSNPGAKHLLDNFRFHYTFSIDQPNTNLLFSSVTEWINTSIKISSSNVTAEKGSNQIKRNKSINLGDHLKNSISANAFHFHGYFSFSANYVLAIRPALTVRPVTLVSSIWCFFSFIDSFRSIEKKGNKNCNAQMTPVFMSS